MTTSLRRCRRNADGGSRAGRGAALLLGGLLVAAACDARAALPSRPNLLLIFTDDHGYADLGAQGAVPDVKTPNLDALARDGVRFKRGYVTAPQCVPSRAGILTGRYQQRFGVEDNTKGPLPREELTLAERLKGAGYISGQVGKWHLDRPGRRTARQEPVQGEVTGPKDPFLPHGQGFDEYFCGSLRNYVASHDLQGRPLSDAPALLTDPRFRIEVQTEAALSFIDRHARDPFFLYLAYYAPHVPLEATEKYLSRFPGEMPRERRLALAMISAMDDGVGLLRGKLRALGLETNTLLFVIGDNGAPLKEGAWNGSLNVPCVGEKGMLTDGGVRTPFVAAWPGVLPAGQVYEPMVSSLDVAATAAALAGLAPDPALDGVNLLPFLTGRKGGVPHETLFWRWRTQAAALDGAWKLILLGPDRRYLFNVTEPDGEEHNRISEHPEIAARLEARLRAWDATLRNPGLPKELNAQDQLFFDVYVEGAQPRATKRGGKRAPPPTSTPPRKE